MRWLIALLMVGVALAGCSDDSGPSAVDDDFDQEIDDRIEATDDTGVIRGVVVDQAIVPVEGATVTVQGVDGSETTNAEGQFGFGGLEPGIYIVIVEKDGFQTAQSQADVQAGIDDPQVLRIQIDAIVGFDPYAQTTTHEGLYQCGTSFLVVCGAPAILFEAFGQDDPLDIDSSTHTFYFQEGMQFLQSEMVWESTQALSPSLYFEMEALDEGCTQYSGEELLDGAAYVGQAEGESPIRVRTGNETLEKQNINPDDCGIYYSVFASGAQGTPVGFSVQQRFTWFLTEFHGIDAIEEWWYVKDGPHEVPG